MQHKELMEYFMQLFFKLNGWIYNPDTIRERRFELRGLTEQFILPLLSTDEQRLVERRCKGNKMPYPPPPNLLADITFVQHVVRNIIPIMEASKNWEVAEQTLAKSKSENTGNDLSDFDKILVGIMSVPKDDLPDSETPESK